jgi:hypothetical protein
MSEISEAWRKLFAPVRAEMLAYAKRRADAAAGVSQAVDDHFDSKAAAAR